VSQPPRTQDDTSGFVYLAAALAVLLVLAVLFIPECRP
jgi:hypothetical protein